MNERECFKVLQPFNAYNQDGEVQWVDSDVVYAEPPDRAGLVRFFDREQTPFELDQTDFFQFVVRAKP